MEIREATYDRALALGYVRLGEGQVARTVPYGDLFAIDFAPDGTVYGLEVFGPVRSIPVDAMVAENGWDSVVWSCLAIAARELERLMDAPQSTGSDGRFRPPTTWTSRSTSTTLEAA